MSEEFWDSFGRPESYIKVAILLITYRYWGPVVKTLLRELRTAAETPRGSLLDREPPEAVHRAPGEDPWISVPLASHRARSGQGQMSSPASGKVAAKNQPRRGGFR